MNESRLSKSKALGAKLMYVTLQVLKDKGGELVGREVVNEVGRRIKLSEGISGEERPSRAGVSDYPLPERRRTHPLEYTIILITAIVLR